MNTTLDRGGDTQAGVTYTVIATRYDEVVTPYPHQFLKAGPGAKVRNITLQDVCPLDLSEHISIAYDSNALQLVLNALDPAHAHPVQLRPLGTPHRRLRTPHHWPTLPSTHSRNRSACPQ